MNKDYEKAMLVIEELIQNIPEDVKKSEITLLAYVYVKISSILDYDTEAKKLIDANLTGYDREMADTYIVEPASDIRCLVRGKALCAGYAEVLNLILNRLGIKTIKVGSKTHAWNQVFINGAWYNLDVTRDVKPIRDYGYCKYFLVSDREINKEPNTEVHECSSSLATDEVSKAIKNAKKIVDIEIQKEILQELKLELKGKISTDALCVACHVRVDTYLIEPFSQYDTFGDELHIVVIDPKRSLVFEHRHRDEYMYFDTQTLDEITPLEYDQSFHTTSSVMGTLYCGYIGHRFNSGVEAINEEFKKKRKYDENRRGYLMTFREYIKQKLGIELEEVTLNQAYALLALTNMVRPRRFVLSDKPDVAKEQLDQKVYMKKKNKKEE